MAVLLVVPAFACADKDEAEVEIEAAPEAPPPAAVAPVTVQVQPMGGATLTGEVVATREAELKYGMCTDAQAHFDAAESLTETTPDVAGTTHDPGDEFEEFDLTVTGATGTGSAEIDLDELRPTEAAYVAIEQDDDLGDDDRLLGCADLTGHGGMDMDAGTGMGTPGPTTPGTEPTTTPGAAEPATR
jgi:hypothetical protein